MAESKYIVVVKYSIMPVGLALINNTILERVLIALSKKAKILIFCLFLFETNNYSILGLPLQPKIYTY